MHEETQYLIGLMVALGLVAGTLLMTHAAEPCAPDAAVCLN